MLDPLPPWIHAQLRISAPPQLSLTTIYAIVAALILQLDQKFLRRQLSCQNSCSLTVVGCTDVLMNVTC